MRRTGADAMIYGYTADGERVPLDPTALRFRGCLLCRHEAVVTGIFIPLNDVMRAVVMKLRTNAPPRHSTGCIAYGLCQSCADLSDVSDRIDRALESEARRLVWQ